MAMAQERMAEALQLMPEKAEALITNAVFKSWFVSGERLVYLREEFIKDHKQVRYVLHNLSDGKEQELFDHQAMATALGQRLGKELDIDLLPIVFEELQADDIPVFSLSPGGKFQLRFAFDGKKISDLSKEVPANARISPDHRKAVYGVEGNLFVMDLQTGISTALTKDGEAEDGYGILCANASGVIAAQLKGTATPVGAFWTQDSQQIFTYRMNLKKVEKFTLVQNVPEGDRAVRPVVYNYHYPLPGDANLPLVEYYLADLSMNRFRSLGLGQIAYSGTMPSGFADSLEGNYSAFEVKNRSNTRSQVYLIEHSSGEIRLLFTETADTFLFAEQLKMQSIGPNATEFSKRKYCISEQLHCMFWLSERNGSLDLYRYELSDGACTQLTDGYYVRQLLYLDAERQLLYFSASNHGMGKTPYQKFPYCLDLSTGELRILLQEDGDHETQISLDGRYLIDSVSAFYRATVTKLYRIDGSLLRTISSCDCSRLLAAGYSYPIGFTIKAADQQTEIHGVMILPPDLDRSKKYPVVEYCYGGNQKMLAPQTFSETISRHAGFSQSLAKLGFICVITDGHGTPLRGKQFHDACYNQMGDCAGIEDHAAALYALAAKYPFFDLKRVGIWGHSGGGFAAFQFMVKKPELYRVGVSSSGNHAQEIYSASWSELFMQEFDRDIWRAQNAEFLADRLAGHLLLIHGDLDDNVHPANTMRIVNALIQADKDFDLLIIPNRHHDLHDHPYYRRRLLEYFIKHLQPEQSS